MASRPRRDGSVVAGRGDVDPASAGVIPFHPPGVMPTGPAGADTRSMIEAVR